VLTRAGRQLEESVDETAEVIDLTESEMTRQQKDRQQFLQQQRDLMMRHTLQVSEGTKRIFLTEL